jgi:hypothetical protein
MSNADRKNCEAVQPHIPLAKMPSELALREWLQGRLFHCTSLKNLRAISRSGGIVPNHGQFPFNHKSSHTSVVHKLGGISLWDLRLSDKWFLCWFPLTRLAIELDRVHVSAHLFEPSYKGPGMRLPGEVGCSAPIPLSWFLGYLVSGPKVQGRRGPLSYFVAGTDLRIISATLRRVSKTHT